MIFMCTYQVDRDKKVEDFTEDGGKTFHLNIESL